MEEKKKKKPRSRSSAGPSSVSIWSLLTDPSIDDDECTMTFIKFEKKHRLSAAPRFGIDAPDGQAGTPRFLKDRWQTLMASMIEVAKANKKFFLRLSHFTMSHDIILMLRFFMSHTRDIPLHLVFKGMRFAAVDERDFAMEFYARNAPFKLTLLETGAATQRWTQTLPVLVSTGFLVCLEYADTEMTCDQLMRLGTVVAECGSYTTLKFNSIKCRLHADDGEYNPPTPKLFGGNSAPKPKEAEDRARRKFIKALAAAQRLVDIELKNLELGKTCIKPIASLLRLPNLKRCNLSNNPDFAWDLEEKETAKKYKLELFKLYD